ncbi:coat protein [Cuneatibacter sp. NSJ-177]|uniref:coat protein n=1 Tax=Cuneatibacter sp. NSJ-177 TaxID=2931401 RepID=UPI001FD17430|nr:coat protein [Cuneatibacter sp. NSJ-177]MCJ7834570.1 coat protein [Cuneatibacter sp. NSJ-177]
MSGTTLQDVIVPELFNPYVINRTMELSALVQSGIVANNQEFDSLASQAAPTVNMPFFEDLTGESEQIIEGTDLDDNKIESNKDVAAIIRRAKMWSATDLSAALSGADPMAAIAMLVARFWERDMQKELVAILNGVFGTVPASGSGESAVAAQTRLASNLLDISSKSGAAANWSGSAFIDAEQLLGDAKAQLTGICMHSATEAYLKKQNLIDVVQPSNDVAFGTYQGKRVIVDDGCPVKSGVYTTYLFGAGAVALGNGTPAGFVPTETDRAKRKGSGVDYLINRKTMILHPRGVAFTSASVAKTEGPSRDELQNAVNWTPVYEPKQIRIVAFKHKLG